MTLLINILISLINACFSVKFLHVFQLKSYSAIRYLSFFCGAKSVYFLVNSLVLLLQFLFPFEIFFLCCVIFLLLFNFAFNLTLIKSKKTPLVFTAKIVRLLVVCVAICFVPFPLKFGCFISNILLLFAPILANFLNVYDTFKNRHFIKQASKKIKGKNIKIIAITGSNGKTSIKNILFEMLKENYVVQASPHSYNTPLGISKFINNGLKDDCQILILEYGARKKGDIKNLCQTFGADYGVISTVAPQHLQTFKTVENVYIAKKELANHLNNKPCVFNLDNLYTLKMFNQHPKNALSASIFAKADVFATNIKIKNTQTYFNLHFNNQVLPCQTVLLGEHNIQNIAISACLAHHLGVPLDKIKTAISNLKFVPHRLELIKGAMNILDDTYNCSLISAQQSIKVLNEFSGKKMIITPGIIEGGKHQFNINKHLGEMCVADWVVIVGNLNKKAILCGLNSQGLNTKKILFAPTLNDAKQYYKLLNSNDTLLFLNDLPDDYC